MLEWRRGKRCAWSCRQISLKKIKLVGSFNIWRPIIDYMAITVLAHNNCKTLHALTYTLDMLGEAWPPSSVLAKLSDLHSVSTFSPKLQDISPFFLRPMPSFYLSASFLHFAAIVACPVSTLAVQWKKATGAQVLLAFVKLYSKMHMHKTAEKNKSRSSIFSKKLNCYFPMHIFVTCTRS